MWLDNSFDNISSRKLFNYKIIVSFSESKFKNICWYYMKISIIFINWNKINRNILIFSREEQINEKKQNN